MGADVNLLYSTTFDKTVGDRSLLQPSTLRKEAYGNSAVAVLGKIHAFLRWKGRIYRQLFFITTANVSPNLLFRDGCYTLGVLKPCYSVETSRSSSGFQGKPQAKPTQPTTNLNQSKMHGISSHHLGNEGTDEEKLAHSTQWSLYKEQLQGMPLRKQDILRVYSDVFTGIGKLPGPPYKFQLKPNAKLARHAPRQVLVHLQEAFHKGYWIVELHPESRKLMTMALDIGRIQWTRLPMGFIIAQDVFQWKLDAIFLSMPEVTGIADDMIIFGKTD